MAAASSQAPYIQDRGQGQRTLWKVFRQDPLLCCPYQLQTAFPHYPICFTLSQACSWPRTNPDSWKVLETSEASALNPPSSANYPLGSSLTPSQPQEVAG